MVAMTTNLTALAVSERPLDPRELIDQIGRMTVLAISGGRVRHDDGTVELPVSSGYSVRIALSAMDTYIVQRVFRRGGKVWIKGTVECYCDEVGDIAYIASCYKNLGFGGES